MQARGRWSGGQKGLLIFQVELISNLWVLVWQGVNPQNPLVRIEEELEVLLTHVHDVVSPKLGLRERNQKEKKGDRQERKRERRWKRKILARGTKKENVVLKGVSPGHQYFQLVS